MESYQATRPNWVNNRVLYGTTVWIWDKLAQKKKALLEASKRMCWGRVFFSFWLSCSWTLEMFCVDFLAEAQSRSSSFCVCDGPSLSATFLLYGLFLWYYLIKMHCCFFNRHFKRDLLYIVMWSPVYLNRFPSEGVSVCIAYSSLLFSNSIRETKIGPQKEQQTKDPEPEEGNTDFFIIIEICHINFLAHTRTHEVDIKTLLHPEQRKKEIKTYLTKLSLGSRTTRNGQHHVEYNNTRLLFHLCVCVHILIYI